METHNQKELVLSVVERKYREHEVSGTNTHLFHKLSSELRDELEHSTELRSTELALIAYVGSKRWVLVTTERIFCSERGRVVELEIMDYVGIRMPTLLSRYRDKITTVPL